jgi:hypothetical protein
MNDEEKSPDELRQEREKAAREANAARNNERLERLNQIANQSDELKVKDGLEDIPDEAWNEQAGSKQPSEGSPDEPEPREVLAQAEAEDKAADEARDAGASDVKVVNGETYYLLVVNGSEQWKTLKELRETSSKVSAADQYLHDAKEAAKRITEASPSTDEGSSPKKGRARELLSRALMGEQEAVDELAQLIDAEPSRVTPDVLQAVDERVDGRLTFRSAVEWFDSEYKEELKDPQLKARIVRRDKEMATLYPDMDFKQRLKEVGDEARAMRRAASPAAPVSQDRLREKEQRKASVRAIPAAAGRTQDDEDEDDGETYESAIAGIAKARGQSRPVVHKR